MRVSVIGGGIIGLLSALRLQQRGARVTVYEKSHIGREASWAAAGLLAPEAEGAEDFALRSRDAYPELIAELGGGIPYAKCGLQELTHERWLPNEAWVDPRALLAAVHQAVLAEGAEVREHTTVDKNVAGDLVVLAAGAWSQAFGAPVRPVRGILLRLKAHVPHIYFWQGGYVVPRPNGECVVGSTMDEAGFDKTISDAACAHVLRQAYCHVPSLRDAPVLDRWCGLRPGADKLILERRGRYIYATGHFRNGILLAPYTASAVTQLAGL